MELKDLTDFLTKEVQKEILFQKHRATGKMLDSVETKSNISGNVVLGQNILIQGFIDDKYAHFVNNGTRPSNKKPSRAMVEEIEKWLQVKGLNYNAYAVAKSVLKQGQPTRGGLKIAERRKNFIEYALESNEKKIDEMLFEIIGIAFENEIENIITKRK